MAAWKQHYHPIQIGKRLLILPAWIEDPKQGRIAVKIDPSMAFGTGTHPTTQLCMELLEDTVQPGQPVDRCRLRVWHPLDWRGQTGRIARAGGRYRQRRDPLDPRKRRRPTGCWKRSKPGWAR